ncbi:sensor histidine kinase [Streptomyces sp. NPDC059009]|uniref:sensor histidine kinase n=1 Tax=Streptomyces sp. NPDC059009 TaxID=3346694 RepID=UPI003686F87E
MNSRARSASSALFGHRARRRWIHLILGGALAMPYVLVGSVVIGPLLGDGAILSSIGSQLLSFAIGLPLAAVTALFPLTRPMSVAAVRALCAVPDEALADGPARSRAAKQRTVAWFTLHLGFGGVISGMSIALPPFALFLIALPFAAVLTGSRLGLPPYLDHTWVLAVAPVAGVLFLVALAACAAAAGGLLARWAPALLGPTPADRLAEAERRAADLAVRGRIARELHDSVGHALSAVTLQASAARRVLDHDPEFVREALAAIEDTTRRTVGELDAVLGVLREAGDARSTAPAPTLAADLDGLLRRTRAGGLKVTATVGLDPAELPPLVSREAYRIVQEALSNALRHGGEGTDVTLRLTLGADPARAGSELTVIAENPLPASSGSAAPRPGGGHGLRGIADRARVLGGAAEWGLPCSNAVESVGKGPDPAAGLWRLTVRLPLKGHP